MKSAKLYMSLLSLFFIVITNAQSPFTAGNIVVYRVGDGTVNFGTNTAQAYPVFLDEYTPAGVKVQSIAMPATANGANHAMVSTPYYIAGFMTLSTDGRFLVCTGYDAGAGATIAPTNASSMARVVGMVKYDASINTTTALSDVASAVGVFPSAVSTNGTDLWVAPTAGNADGVTGVATNGLRYSTVGSTTSTQVETAVTALRSLNITNGQLYFSASSGSARIGAVGSGTPTTSGQVTAGLPGVTSTYAVSQFVLLDESPTVAGVDVLYMAAYQAGIYKYSFNGTTWTSNGLIGVASDEYTGLTGAVSGGTVTLYGTRTGSNNTTMCGGQLVKITDATGYGASVTTTPPTITVLADPTQSPTSYTANTYSFHGVAFVPQAGTLPVILESVTASQFASDILVNWNTATEVNTNHFEVERSWNTIDFITVETVVAKGSNNHYRFTDAGIVSKAPGNTIYYRIKMVDNDGTTSYSKIVSVPLNNKQVTLLSSYPNPFVDAITATLSLQQAGPVELSVTDLEGKTLKMVHLSLAAGSNTVLIPGLGYLAKATYLLKAISNGATTIIKLVK